MRKRSQLIGKIAELEAELEEFFGQRKTAPPELRSTVNAIRWVLGESDDPLHKAPPKNETG